MSSPRFCGIGLHTIPEMLIKSFSLRKEMLIKSTATFLSLDPSIHPSTIHPWQLSRMLFCLLDLSSRTCAANKLTTTTTAKKSRLLAAFGTLRTQTVRRRATVRFAADPWRIPLFVVPLPPVTRPHQLIVRVRHNLHPSIKSPG